MFPSPPRGKECSLVDFPPQIPAKTRILLKVRSQEYNQYLPQCDKSSVLPWPPTLCPSRDAGSRTECQEAKPETQMWDAGILLAKLNACCLFFSLCNKTLYKVFLPRLYKRLQLDSKNINSICILLAGITSMK